MKKYEDGWTTINGQDVLIENGLIVRGTTGEGTSYRPVYPYKYNKSLDSWVKQDGITPDDLLSGGYAMK